MQQIKAAIFDMDGVLINTEPLHYRMWKEAFHRRGLEIEYDKYKDCIGTTHAFLMDLIWKNYGWDFRQDEKIRPEALAIKEEMIEKEGFPQVEGVKEMLQGLKAAGFHLAIASSSPVDYIEIAMQHIGIREYFEVICSGDYVKHSKPEPDIYLLAAKQLGLDVRECIVLEDSSNGCKAAIAAGMKCVGFYNPDSGDQDLSGAVCVIDKLLDFNRELIRKY